MLGREPRRFGVERTRWTLATLGAGCPWLAGLGPSGVRRALARLGVALKRGRHHVHSPDPAYAAKREAVAARLAEAAAPGRVVALFQDEAGLTRQPSLAAAWSARGRPQPRARRSLRADTGFRLAAALDPRDGRVVARRAPHFGVAELVAFYQDIAAAYPEAERVYLVQDNWPVHFHPDLLAALEPQECPWPFPRPRGWPAAPSPAAVARWGALRLPIQLVPLPTYAPWLNPVEKLWRRLRQEVAHLHPWADDLPALGAAADAFLARFARGSPDLLRYVGLAAPD